MKAYLSIIKIRFMLLLQYRVAAAAGVFTQLFFGFVRVMVFYAFYSAASSGQPMSYAQTITYVWIGQAMLGTLPWNGDSEIQDMIRSGNVAYELCRPMDIYNQWFSRAVALRIAPVLLRAVPIFVITILFLPRKYAMGLPPSLGAGLAWAAATLGAIMLSCSITNIMNISTLWTISGEGLARLLPAVVTILSGMIVPLPLFPDWMRRVLAMLPFSGLVDIPVRFYTGHIPYTMILPYLLNQLLWTLILVAFGRWLLSRKMKSIVVQGG